MSGISLVVGLGNPGPEYEKTRHNAGTWFVSELVNQTNSILRFESKFHGMHCCGSFAGQDIHFLIPTTFMNLSGQAVKSAANYFKLVSENILIVHDEVDLAAGDIRLKYDGGHGGHNGLKDIIRHLSTHQFHRLRIGVGRPVHSTEVVDYVLNAPTKNERIQINQAIQSAIDVMPLVINGEFQKAMMQLHTRE